MTEHEREVQRIHHQYVSIKLHEAATLLAELLRHPDSRLVLHDGRGNTYEAKAKEERDE